jgi:ketose-bisphosphate aldolase
MARVASEELEVPVALHLDHGKSYELAARAIEAGYTSVMIDGSALPFEDNVALTRRVVELARTSGVSVEAEIGHVGPAASADARAFYTRPEDAVRFVESTNVDSLAVAVGTQHGFYKGEVALDFERLAAIQRALPEVPLVLHGGSGLTAELLTRAIKFGIAKVNFGTELKDAFTRAVRDSMAGSTDIDLRRSFAPAIAAVRRVSATKLDVCWTAARQRA